jgi:hypothetical protein
MSLQSRKISALTGLAVLLLGLLGTVIIQRNLEQSQDLATEAKYIITPKTVRVFDSFEENNSLETWNTQTALPENIVQSHHIPARNGTYSLQINVHKSDQWQAGGPRSELLSSKKLPAFGAGDTTTAKMSVYFPDDYVNDPAQEIIFQVHATNQQGVPFFIQSVRDELVFRGRGISTTSIPKTKGRWMDIAVKHRWSDTANGATQVIVNGETLISEFGSNVREDQDLYYKFGIYKSGWKDPSLYSNTTERTLYFDAIELSGEFQ